MKKLTVILIASFVVVNAFAEELIYVTSRDATLWDIENEDLALYEKNEQGVLPKGTEVEIDFSWLHYGVLILPEVTFDGNTRIEKNVYIETLLENQHIVDLQDIVPIDTPDLFEKTILTEAHRPSRYLIQGYLVDILQSGRRNTMKNYEEEWISKRGGDNGDEGKFWWEHRRVLDSSVITQSIISLNFTDDYYVRKIQKIEKGYQINAFSKAKESMLIVYLQFDGDYVDVYENSLENKVGTYVYVSPELYEGVQTVIKEDVPVDLTNMIWPRRADGSSDYDDKILTRQEIPRRITDPLDDTYLVITENTTIKQLEEIKKELGEEGFKKVLNKPRTLQDAIINKAPIEILQFLINEGLDVRKTQGILITAVETTDDLEVIKLLVENGVSVFDTKPDSPVYDPEGAQSIALHYIVNQGELRSSSLDFGNYRIVQYLIDKGADVEAKDYKGRTVLRAAIGSSPEIITILLNAGARLDAKDPSSYRETRGMTITEVSKTSPNHSPYEKIFLPLETMGWQEGVDKIIWQEMGSVYKTTDKLRLRSSEGTSGEALLTLANNTAVRVREIGTLEKIDGLIAFWLQVEVAEDSKDTEGNAVAKGTTGWLFGGYVSMEKEAGYEVKIAEEEPMFGDNASDTEENKEAEPFFPLIPIIAGVSVLLLCAIIVVVKTKKKSKE